LALSRIGVLSGAAPAQGEKVAMLRDWLPGYCSRLRIFLSFSSEHRPLAEKVAQTLKNSGHHVFFDKDSLPPASDYNERIRRAIRYSDRFLFLASRTALEKGKFTLTEIEFAKQRWPSPVGRVFPVIIDSELRLDALPTYLSSVQTLSIAGNAPAEIAATIDRAGNMRSVCWACLGVSTLGVAGMAGIATGVIPIFSAVLPAEVAAVAPQYVHFRSRQRPPDDPSVTGADTTWTSSPLTETLPIAYSSQNIRSAPAQVLEEQVELRIGSRKDIYGPAHVVRISGTSVAQSTCGTDWLCVKSNWSVETLAPGATIYRETMFLPVPGSPLLWRQLIDLVLADDGPLSATIVWRAKLVSADGSRRSEFRSEVECRLDLAALRQRLLVYFKPGLDPRPPTLQPRCQQ
jgi:TIR domain